MTDPFVLVSSASFIYKKEEDNVIFVMFRSFSGVKQAYSGELWQYRWHRRGGAAYALKLVQQSCKCTGRWRCRCPFFTEILENVLFKCVQRTHLQFLLPFIEIAQLSILKYAIERAPSFSVDRFKDSNGAPPYPRHIIHLAGNFQL